MTEAGGEGSAGRMPDQGLGLCQGLWPMGLLHWTKRELRFFWNEVTKVGPDGCLCGLRLCAPHLPVLPAYLCRSSEDSSKFLTADRSPSRWKVAKLAKS